MIFCIFDRLFSVKVIKLFKMWGVKVYINSKTYEVKYSDVDFQDFLKLSSLLSFMQESACISADELGFGYADLQPNNYGFVITNWYVKLDKPIKLGDKVTVCTWPVEPKKIIVMRDFEFFVEGERIGVATSRWCLINLNDFSILPCALALKRNFDYNPFRSVENVNFKIARFEGGQPNYEKTASYSDCDHYGHVNNTKYADLISDAFTMEEVKGKYIKEFNINYVKQCKFGEKLELTKSKQDDGSFIIQCSVDGELRTQAQLYFND